MKKINFAGLIPLMLILGTWIGNKLVVPMIPKVVDALYYKDKYNNEASMYYSKYMVNSMEVEIIMPDFDSKLSMHNVDDIRFPLVEVFKTSSDTKDFFNFPSADYRMFYCVEYKKYMNIITFHRVNGRYSNKLLRLTINREDMTNPLYGTMDNPIPVLKAVGVSEPIWFDGRDTDAVFMDKFYRNNVIQYLKYKMPKEEFERRFKGKTK